MRLPGVSFQWVVLGVLLFSCLIVAANGNFFTNFLNPELSHAPRFPLSQLYIITEKLALEGVVGQVVCFGDLNNDKFTDLFVLTNSSYLMVYLWQHSTYSFQPSASFVSDSNILSVVAGDFNYDGLLDVLVTGSSTPTTQYLHLFLAFNSTANAGTINVYTEAPILITDSLVDQPLVFDANADLKLDILAISSLSNLRTVWINNGEAAFTPFNLTSSLPTENAVVNSNSFADINGDCLADLVLVTPDNTGVPSVQVYINDKTATPLTFTQPDLTLESQPGMGQLTIADFDGDGTLDLLFPVCSTSSSKSKTRGSKGGSGADCSSSTIHVVYNIQMPLCQGMFGSSNPVSLATMSESGSASGSESKPCRQQDAMCTADPDYYISSLSATSNQAHHVVVDLSSGSAGLQFGAVVSNPLTLRYGDYNFDGYPDLLIPVVTTNGDRVVQLWENVACAEETCGEMATGFDHRTFQLVDDSTTAVLATTLNAYAGAFFDFDEDGSLDILLLVDSGLNGTSPAVKSTVGVFNNIYTDAYFLKTLGLNGLCPAWCDEGVKFPDPKPYGVNLPGGTFKFTVTDLSGDPRAAIGTQLTQSSYLPLQTPYLLFGLGRTNNYIDNLFYGVTIQNEYEQHFAYFICVIPNSQIVAIPYPSSDPAQWILELYINPSEFTLWVVVAILVSLFLLFLVIMFFRRREKNEDEAEKRERAHLFSFDAM